MKLAKFSAKLVANFRRSLEGDFRASFAGENHQKHFHLNSTPNFTIKLHYEVLGCGGPYININLFGSNFPRTFPTLTSGCPKKFLPITGAAGECNSWPGRQQFLVRTSMARRVLEKFCAKKKVCIAWKIGGGDQFSEILLMSLTICPWFE